MPTTLHADMNQIAAAVLARWNEKHAHKAPPPAPPAPSREQLQAELAAAELGFEPNDQYADDHGVWHRHMEKAARIRALRRQLAETGTV